jgi:hypothetical protein
VDSVDHEVGLWLWIWIWIWIWIGIHGYNRDSGNFNSAADQRESCAMSFCSEFHRSHTRSSHLHHGCMHTYRGTDESYPNVGEETRAPPIPQIEYSDDTRDKYKQARNKLYLSSFFYIWDESCRRDGVIVISIGVRGWCPCSCFVAGKFIAYHAYRIQITITTF